MKKIFSKDYALIQTTDILFINHPSTIYADNSVIITLFTNEKDLFSHVLKNVVIINTSTQDELKEGYFYKEGNDIIVIVDNVKKVLNEKDFDNIIDIK